MPYQKKIWCAHPKHSNSTRSGRNPSHPVGRVIINAIQADMFNKEISSNTEWSSTRLMAGDKLCEQCFKFMSLLSNHLSDPQEMDIDIEDPRTTSDTSEENEDLVESPSSEEPLYLQQKATEELNAVFQLLKMGKIRDGLVFFLRLYAEFSVFQERFFKITTQISKVGCRQVLDFGIRLLARKCIESKAESQGSMVFQMKTYLKNHQTLAFRLTFYALSSKQPNSKI